MRNENDGVFPNEIDLIWEGDVSWAEHAPVIVQKVQEVLDLLRSMLRFSLLNHRCK